MIIDVTHHQRFAGKMNNEKKKKNNKQEKNITKTLLENQHLQDVQLLGAQLRAPRTSQHYRIEGFKGGP